MLLCGSMIETGIPRLDEYFRGGIPKGRSLLFYIEPGLEGGKLGMQIIHHNLMQGKTVIYVVSSLPPKLGRESFKEMGWDLDRFPEHFSIIDGYSYLVGIPTEEKIVVRDPHDILDYADLIAEQVGKCESSPLVVFESLSTLIDLCGEKNVLVKISQWKETFQVEEVTSIYNFVAWPYSEAILNKVRRTFDAIVDVNSICERVIIGQCYCPSKIKWGGVTGNCILFKVCKPGGVRDYIPRVLVTGPHQSGKTAFVTALSTRPVSVEKLRAKVALDHGFVEYNGFAVDIFGTPGQDWFDTLLDIMGGEAMGIFIVVDSSQPSQFPRAKEMMDKTFGSGLPYVVVANKQDVTGALGVEEIREKMGIANDIPIVPATATKKIGVFEAFEKLIGKITKRRME